MILSLTFFYGAGQGPLFNSCSVKSHVTLILW